MLVSVVNLSEYTDEHVQEVLRAVNRQIAEDFAPYWHRSGELRLEGAVGRRPDPGNPRELRGDAILYLWEEVDQARALGFHDLNFRGIPFSIVFTALSEQLGEDWSVTLSHEALELLVDPEANLLVEGPHPDDPQRRILHWYEVCDAVQAQSYAIDGVAVSNFLLPLYFTESDETGSRNDFLGEGTEGEALPSFGVAPGGYIGFFDPESGEHDQFVSPRGRGRERLAARQRAGLTRRTVRRQVRTSPEPVLRSVLGLGSDEPLPGPWFEGFALDVRAAGRGDPWDRLEAAARAVLGGDWESRWTAWEPARAPGPGGPVPYELVPRQPVAPAEAWELAHALRGQPGVADVEPEFVFFQADSEAIEELPSSRRWAALFGSGHLGGTEDAFEWSLDQIRVRGAWAHARGERIAIGHPDTGFLEHPEIWPGAGPGPIDTARDYDFVADEDDARAEPREDDLLPGGPGHGTSTASVIVSAEGPADGDRSRPWVSGVAPEATLVPLRVSNSVVHFSMRRVRKAIEYATASGFPVVSMSLGGPFPGRHLRRAVRAAADAGVVLVAAAGNHIPFRPVIWPARFAEVIACAACNVDGGPWRGSSRGDAVDVAAPGESVWRAFWDGDAAGGDRFRVERSSGTSYATAHVAGVCALWLARHGRRALHERYGGQLAEAFRSVLRRTARPGSRLDAGFGAGIVDAEALVRAPLPSRQALAAAARGRGRGRRARRAEAPDPLEGVRALLPHLTGPELRRGLEALVGSGGPAATAGALGEELSFHFAADPRLRRQFSARCRRSARAAGVRGLGGRRLDRMAYGALRSRIARHGSPSLARALGPP